MTYTYWNGNKECIDCTFDLGNWTFGICFKWSSIKQIGVFVGPLAILWTRGTL